MKLHIFNAMKNKAINNLMLSLKNSYIQRVLFFKLKFRAIKNSFEKKGNNFLRMLYKAYYVNVSKSSANSIAEKGLTHSDKYSELNIIADRVDYKSKLSLRLSLLVLIIQVIHLLSMMHQRGVF